MGFGRRTAIAVLAFGAIGLALGAEPAATEGQAPPQSPATEPQPAAPAPTLGTEQSPVVVRMLPSAQAESCRTVPL